MNQSNQKEYGVAISSNNAYWSGIDSLLQSQVCHMLNPSLPIIEAPQISVSCIEKFSHNSLLTNNEPFLFRASYKSKSKRNSWVSCLAIAV